MVGLSNKISFKSVEYEELPKIAFKVINVTEISVVVKSPDFEH